MAIVVVGGSARGVGKTTLVCGLLAALDRFRWTAVKITSDAHQGLPPIYEEKTAGTESDTARYLGAGAQRAFLLSVSPERDLAGALDEFWPRISPGTNLIFESNRVMSYVSADVCLLVRGDAAKASKPSFHRALRYADAMVAVGDEDRMVADAMIVAEREPGPIFYLKRLNRISDEMNEWIRERMSRASSQ